MKFKSGVDPRYLSAPAWYALHLADQLHREETGRQAVCTSTGEGIHSVERSRHYPGIFGFGFAQAFDLRIWYLDDAAKFADKLRVVLGGDYCVILEKTHIHVHWAPVYRPAQDDRR